MSKLPNFHPFSAIMFHTVMLLINANKRWRLTDMTAVTSVMESRAGQARMSEYSSTSSLWRQHGGQHGGHVRAHPQLHVSQFWIGDVSGVYLQVLIWLVLGSCCSSSCGLSVTQTNWLRSGSPRKNNDLGPTPLILLKTHLTSYLPFLLHKLSF